MSLAQSPSPSPSLLGVGVGDWTFMRGEGMS